MKTWKRTLSVLLTISLIAALFSSMAVLADEPATTTTFPEYYTQYEAVPGDGKLIGTDYIALGLKMTDEEIDAKIEALLNTMTDEEKATYLGGGGTGTVYGNAGDLPGTARLGVPEVRMHDGPSGVLSLWPTTNTPNRQMAAATCIEQGGGGSAVAGPVGAHVLGALLAVESGELTDIGRVAGSSGKSVEVSSSGGGRTD